jgi:hypothetical protein
LLERERLPWAVAYARLVRAGLAEARGNARDAVAGFSDAADRFERAGMKLCAASARRRQGLLRGDSEGAGLVAAADVWMRTQQIRRPDRMAAVYAPDTARLR